MIIYDNHFKLYSVCLGEVEKISKKALNHSSRGEFTNGETKSSTRLKSGWHGEENIKELNRRNIKYEINIQHPNRVRLGNIPTHKNGNKRKNNGQCWFPENWTRKTIKKAGEKTMNSIPYKLLDEMTTFGTYKKIKIGVRCKFEKVSTFFHYYKQS